MKKKLLLLLALCFTATGFSQDVKLVGGFQGWNLGNGIAFATTDNEHYTLSNYTIQATELKFVVNSSWDTAYGFQTAPGYPSGTGGLPGTNIAVPAGTYNIAFNKTTKAYSFTAGVNPNAVISVTGSGAPSPVSMYTTDGINYTALSIPLSSGNLSFAVENSSTYGNAAFPSGTATAGGSAVVTPAGGTFNIAFNKNTGAYAFTPTVVGMIGVGGPSGSWDVDANMTSTDGIVYTLNNVTITAGTMKIRDNAKWDLQFGAQNTATTPFPSGVAVKNGSDMQTVSGTYNITFNRTTLAYNFADVLSVNDSKINTFKVYPNPSNNNWNFVASQKEITSVEIIDALGKTVISKKAASTEVNIDASGLSQGVYVAKVASENKIQTIKVIKN